MRPPWLTCWSAFPVSEQRLEEFTQAELRDVVLVPGRGKSWQADEHVQAEMFKEHALEVPPFNDLHPAVPRGEVTAGLPHP
jgi:hypothetical protein